MDTIKNILRYTQLIAIIVIALWLLYSGMMKLVGYPGMEESFLVWGYSKTMMLIVGVVEIVLAIGIFARPTRNLAFTGLIILMTGAIYTHVSHMEYGEMGAAMWILVASIFFLAYNLLGIEGKLEQWVK